MPCNSITCTCFKMLLSKFGITFSPGSSSHILRGGDFMMMLIPLYFLITLLLTTTAYSQFIPLNTDTLPRFELQKNKVRKLTPVFDYWLDSTHRTTIDSLLWNNKRVFQRTTDEILSLGYQNTTLWCRFVVRYYANAQDTSHDASPDTLHSLRSDIPREPFILPISNRQADTAILFCVNSRTGAILCADTVGYSVPFEKWNVQTSFLAFTLPSMNNFTTNDFSFGRDNSEQYSEMLCYVQIRINATTFASFDVINYKNFQKNWHETARTRFLIWFGIALFACCYNFVLFFVTRSRFYLYYVFTVTAYTLYRATTAGNAYTFIEMLPGIHAYLSLISGLLYNLTGALFVLAFWRERKEYIPTIIYKALLGYIALNIIAIVADLFGGRHFAYFVLYYSFVAFGTPIMLIGTFILWRKGYTPALYLLVARGCMEVGLLIYYAESFKGIYNSVLSGQIASYSAWIAPFIELLLFSFALAARFTVLQQEKQVAEQKALEGELYRIKNVELSEANEEITRQQNILLEQSRDIQEMNVQVTELNYTLQEQNEKLAEANREKDEIMGMVVHDLKNPIGAVRGFAELISQGVLEEKKQVEDASLQILTTSERMLEIVKNLLTLNHLESGVLVTNGITFNMNNLIEGCIDQYRVLAEKKHITLHFTPDGNSYEICADESLVMQVFDNLVSNAVKYSPWERNVYIRLSLNHETNSVRLEVQDEGPGVSEEDMQKLFGKFQRLSAQPTAGEHSTGLGLSIVKKMVEAMNGRVWCESELGKGATFIVELPAVQPFVA